MSVSPESIKVRKRYVIGRHGKSWIRRVIQVTPDQRVYFTTWPADPTSSPSWKLQLADRANFASAVLREVPCDWTPKRRDEV